MSFIAEIAKNKRIKKPVIFGISSPSLTDDEKYFFEKNGPLGFIIFSRNIIDKNQLKNLVSSLKEVMEGEVLVLVDQEGGRVARLRGECWKAYESGKYFADLYEEDQNLAKEKLFENFLKIGHDLAEVGINVNCAPVLDILMPQTHKVIGDRAYGSKAHQVLDLGKEVCKSLLQNNVYPVIKHIPGHGRGNLDSHEDLPIVDCSLKELEENDFIPFKGLRDQKFAMTAHIVYSKIDDKKPATTSAKMVDLIRNNIGFKNILMTDDLSMKALKGTMESRTKESLQAGCDLILHCNGKMEEMVEINKALPFINDEFLERLIK